LLNTTSESTGAEAWYERIEKSILTRVPCGIMGRGEVIGGMITTLIIPEEGLAVFILNPAEVKASDGCTSDTGSRALGS
jgi:hypothetical protein